ncbi:MAG: ribonuclease D, partial [Moraxella sp.]|nr:ribonuclease D [Moraxella sp.]
IDVQLAVAYLTGELQMGYARAIDECLGVSLDKTESKSDWLVRPLSHEQESYAADDVRYLLALWEFLKGHLDHKKLTSFFLEDSCLYAYELHQTHHLPDDQLYLDYVAPNYSHRQVAVLQALITWRERLARSTNKLFVIL